MRIRCRYFKIIVPIIRCATDAKAVPKIPFKVHRSAFTVQRSLAVLERVAGEQNADRAAVNLGALRPCVNVLILCVFALIMRPVIFDRENHDTP